MKVKILSFLLLIILFASCNRYSREKYPKLVSKTASHREINSCYSADFDSLNKIPTEIQNKISSYLKIRLGNKTNLKLEFDYGYVLSDKPIEIKKTERTESEKELDAIFRQEVEKTDCDTIVAFPIYSVLYQFKKPKIGIEKVEINLTIDRNGNVIKDIDFPKAEFINRIIPIDSVHSELIRRKIPYKKLNIHLWFDKKTESFIWSTSTLISEGSILGPSCFSEIKYHFKMNATTGKITEYDFEKREEYFAASDNHYFE